MSHQHWAQSRALGQRFLIHLAANLKDNYWTAEVVRGRADKIERNGGSLGGGGATWGVRKGRCWSQAWLFYGQPMSFESVHIETLRGVLVLSHMFCQGVRALEQSIPITHPVV